MAKEKSLVEEAIIQMKNLEEAVAENAKGILASTMKEEIKELVKESLSEQDDDEVEVDTDVEMEEPEMGDEEETDNDDMADMEDMDDMDDMEDDDEETIDLTDVDDEDEILRVFRLMGPDDNIVVTKDEAGNINLKDEEDEYMIVGEGEEDDMLEGEWSEMDDMGMSDASIEEIVSKVFNDYEDEGEDGDEEEYVDYEEEGLFEQEGDEDPELYEEDGEDMGGYADHMEEEDQIVYEIVMDEEMGDEDPELEEMWGGNKHDFKRRGGHKIGDVDGHYKDYESDELEEEYMEEMYDDLEEGDEFDIQEPMEGDEFDIQEPMAESKMTIKPKGMGMGNPGKFKYSNKPNQDGGFKTVKKKVNKTMGTGKAKFEYKEGENMDGKNKPVKKVETKEASRTLGNGKYFRKGGLPKQRAHSEFNANIKENDVKEMNVLRLKNEEYRKALNVFRNKLNEVAVFNSNLAYATRLFTEHSTSKQEKINILRRFDGVETLKESKNLYKVIKDELSVKTSQPMNESIERKIENVQATGSSVNLIESKTYENPQFLRMKDLMAKIK